MLASGLLTYGSKSNFFFLKDQIRFMIHAVTILATLRPIQVLLMEVICTEEGSLDLNTFCDTRKSVYNGHLRKIVTFTPVVELFAVELSLPDLMPLVEH